MRKLPNRILLAASLVTCATVVLDGPRVLAQAPGATLLLSPDGTIVFDTINGVNWLGDANLAATNRFGLPLCNGSGPGTKTCVNASGSMNYGAATAWVNAMNAANYLGHSDWQLPTTPFNDSACAKTGPNGGSFGFGCTAGALDSLYNALGLKPPNTAVPIPSNNASPFSNLQPYLYWSQTSEGPTGGNLTFSFATGWQGANTLPNFLYLLPMIRGTVPGSPPAAGNGLQVSSDKQTVYDPMTNSTWVANANLAGTNRFGLPLCTNPTSPSICVAQDGAMTYASATEFIKNMNTAAYLGQTHWQMPSIDTSCPGYTCTGDRNPMGNLFYDQFGILPGLPAVATPNIAVGPFHNLQPYLYWACQGASIESVCSTDVPAPNFEWSYSFGSGFQGTDLLANSLYVTAYFPAPLQPFVNAGQALTANAGGGSINVTLPAAYAWTASTTANWITITGGGSGVGNGTLTYQVAPNAGMARSATITVAGFSFTVEQAASLIPGLARAGSLAQVASEGTWKFTLDAVNLGASAAVARFNFADNLGNPLTMPLTFPQLPPAVGPLLAATLDRTINPSAQLIMESTGPDSAPALVGWGQLLTNGNIGGFGIFSDPKAGWNAVVPLETRNASRYILAFDNTGTLATGVAVANLAPQPANVPILIRDDSGAQIGTPVISLGTFGHTSFMLNDSQLGFPVTANKRGTIEFETPPEGQISVLGLRANGPALTTLPVLANVGAGGGSITHVTFNGGFTSVFYIVNTGTVPAKFTLSFFDEGGSALQVPLVLPQTGSAMTTSSLTSTLAAGALLVVQTQSQDSLPSVLGSAQLASTGSVSGFEIFLWIPFGQEASVPLETRTPNSFVLLFDDTTGLTTGVAVANLASSAATIKVNLRDDTGAPLAPSAPINLPARGHTSFLLPTNYSVTSGKRGTAEFVVPAGGNISVIGLRAKSDGTLTTIPLLTK